VRIATKTLIVVLVCLIGAGLSASVVFYYYNALESVQKQREISVLALRDVENFRTITSQWFVTIDLFFNAEQSYLANGIKRQAVQMKGIVDTIHSYENSEDGALFEQIESTITAIQTAVSEASILRDRQGKKWNAYVETIDELSMDMIDSIDLLYDNFEAISSANEKQYEEKKLQFDQMLLFSIAIYLLSVFISWLWASKNIAKPLETLNSIAKNAVVDRGEMSFELAGGSKEVLQLSRSLQEFSDRLYLAKKKSEKRKQELQESVDKLQEARLELVQAEKMASVGNLAAGVAHEINNPVGFISGNFNTLKGYVDDLSAVIQKQKACIEALCADDADKTALLEDIIEYQEEMDIEFILPDLVELLQESGDGLERVKTIVSDLLEFSHVNSPDKVATDINELLNKTASVLSNNLPSSLNDKITLRKDYHKLPLVFCHGGKIAQVLLKVLENAIDAIESEGIIALKTFAQGKKVYIEIQDSGCGISEDNIHRIYDPFFTTKEIGQGTGLGLHTAQSILEKHEGNIRVTSKEGVGTKFRIELPVGEDSATVTSLVDSVA